MKKPQYVVLCTVFDANLMTIFYILCIFCFCGASCEKLWKSDRKRCINPSAKDVQDLVNGTPSNEVADVTREQIAPRTPNPPLRYSDDTLLGYLHRYPRDADWKGETEKTSSKVSNETNDRRKDVQPEKRESNRTETPSTPGKSLHAGKDKPGTHHRSGLNNRESLIQLNIKIPPEISTGDDTGYHADDEKNVGVQTVTKEEEQNWQTLPHASQKLSHASQPSVPLPSQQEVEQTSDDAEQTEAPDTQSKLQEIFRALRVRNMPIGDAGEPEKPHPSYRKYIDEWPGDVDVIDDESDNEMDDDMDDKDDENSLFTIHVSVDKGTNQKLVAKKLNQVPHCSNGAMRKLPVPSFTHHVKTYLAYRGLRVKHFKPIFAKHGQHAFLFSALSEDDKDANGLVALEIDVGKPREVRGFVFKALRGMTDKDEGNNDDDEDEGGQATVTKFKLQYTDSDSIWRAIKTDEGKSLEFSIVDTKMPQRIYFPKPLLTTAMRIYPQDWIVAPWMRLQILYCGRRLNFPMEI